MTLVPLDPRLIDGPLPFWIEAFGLGPSVPVGGETTTVLWAFEETGATPGDHAYRTLTDAERRNIEVSLDRVAEGTGLRFVETTRDVAQMLIGATSDPDETAFGLAWQATSGPVHVVAIDTHYDTPEGLANNTYIYVHEILHGVGLDHATRAFGSVSPVVIPDDLDNGTTLFGNWTVAWESATQLFDLARLQFVYGPDPTQRAGDDSYTPTLGVYDPETDPLANVPLLWDGGGLDVLDLTGAAGPVTASLMPGFVSQVDTANTGILEAGTFSINYNTVIETLLGGVFNDMLSGSDLGDVIDAGEGHDSVTGGFGPDLLRGGIGDDVIAGDMDAPEVLTPYRPGDGVQTITADQTGPVALENGWSLAFNADILRSTERPWQSVEITGSGEGFEVITFDGIEGETWIFDVDDATFPNFLRLFGPDGVQVAFNDTSDPGLGAGGSTSAGDSFIGYQLTESGSYTLQLGHGLIAGPLTDVHVATIQISNVDAVLSVEGGADTLVGGPGNDILMGEGGPDLLTGGQGFDTAMGGSGNDTLDGLDGFDSFEGGAGDDLLRGNFGNDTLLGDGGNDTLEGGLGFDSLWGGDGADFLQARDGFDTLAGGLGADTLEGNNGNDRLFGDAGADLLLGGLGADTLQGGAGNDTLEGANGFDLLQGDADNDVLVGGAGNDTLDGGAGLNTLRGGLGADTFVYTGGVDRISDFQPIDGLRIDADLLSQANPDADDLRVFVERDGDGNVMLDFGSGNTLTFLGISATGVVLDDVSFI